MPVMVQLVDIMSKRIKQKSLYLCALWLLKKRFYPNKYPDSIYLKPLYDCCHEGLLHYIKLIITMSSKMFRIHGFF